MSKWTETLSGTKASEPRYHPARERFLVRESLGEFRPAFRRERPTETAEEAMTPGIVAMWGGRNISAEEVARSIFYPYFVVTAGTSMKKTRSAQEPSAAWGRIGHGVEDLASEIDSPVFTVISAATSLGSGSNVSWAPLEISLGSAATGATALPSLGAQALRDWQTEVSLERLFEIASDEQFEDGMDSNLGAGLRALFASNAAQTMECLRKRLRETSLSWEVLTETLKVLARIDNAETKGAQLIVILDFLKHPSMLIRDAALTALSLLGDRQAIPQLERVAREEANPWFRHEIEATILELRG